MSVLSCKFLPPKTGGWTKRESGESWVESICQALSHLRCSPTPACLGEKTRENRDRGIGWVKRFTTQRRVAPFRRRVSCYGALLGQSSAPLCPRVNSSFVRSEWHRLCNENMYKMIKYMRGGVHGAAPVVAHVLSYRQVPPSTPQTCPYVSQPPCYPKILTPVYKHHKTLKLPLQLCTVATFWQAAAVQQWEIFHFHQTCSMLNEV